MFGQVLPVFLPRLVAAAILAFTVALPLAADAPAERTALLVSINDTYRAEGLDDGAKGGFPRVRALRRELEGHDPELLLFHAGDLFFPSLISRIFQGEQMVDGLNRLDGTANGFDPRLFITFGNHEFDKKKLADAAIVQARVSQSHFTWLAGNLRFGSGADGKPLVAGPNLVASKIVTSGGIKVGIFGLTIDTTKPDYASFTDAFAAARQLTKDLRGQGAEVVVALTHLDLADDKRLLRELGAEGPDLILGGHEHTIQREEVGGRFVCKADSDAASACLVRVTIDGAGKRTIGPPEHRSLYADKPAPDPDLERTARHWVEIHELRLCASTGRPAGCLGEVVGHTQTELDGEETQIRAYETNLGNWLADRMLEAFRAQGARIAFINSGSLRLNHDVAAHSAVSERALEELFGYPTEVRLVKITGKILKDVVAHAVEGWPGKGWWLQIAGFAFAYDPEEREAFDVTLLTPEGPRPVRDEEEILAVATDFLTSTSDNQDGYTMLKPELVIATGEDLKNLARRALRAAGEAGIAPKTEGRICVAGAVPCLAVKEE